MGVGVHAEVASQELSPYAPCYVGGRDTRLLVWVWNSFHYCFLIFVCFSLKVWHTAGWKQNVELDKEDEQMMKIHTHLIIK